MVTRGGWKRLWVWLALAALMGLALSLAYAENELTVSAYLTPADLVAPGEAKLTVLLYNPTESAALGVSLSPSEKQQGASIGNIAPGESAKFEYEMTVTQKALNAGGVDVYVQCTLNGQRVRQHLTAPVKQVAALAEAEFSRRVSGEVVRAGEVLALSYTLKNVGSVALNNVVVFDSLDNYSFPAFSLEPGEIRELSREVTLNSSAVSRVSASFTSGLSGSQYYLYADEITVSVREDEVLIAPAAEESDAPGELQLVIENKGLYNYVSLSLSEPTLGRLPFIPAALRAGETVRVSVPLPARTEDASYLFTLTLRDENGAVCAIEAAPIAVKADAHEDRPVTLSARGVGTGDSEGDVAFDLTLTTGAQALKGAIIGEKTLGELRALVVVPALAETEIYLPCAYAASGKYEFYASYQDAAGVWQTVYAEAVTALNGARAEDRGRSWLESAVLLIVQKLHLTKGVMIVCAAALALIVAGLILRRRLRRRNALKGATNKFVPVHAKNGTKEKE